MFSEITGSSSFWCVVCVFYSDEVFGFMRLRDPISYFETKAELKEKRNEVLAILIKEDF